MIRIADVTTKRTVDVALERRGMESVQCLMEQACSAFGASRILKLVVGDLVIPQDDWARHSVDTYMLLGEPWMVKCFDEYKSDGPIAVRLEGVGVTTYLDLGPQHTFGDLADMMSLKGGYRPGKLRFIYNGSTFKGYDKPLATWGLKPHTAIYAFPNLRGGGGPTAIGVPLSFVDIARHSLPTRKEWSTKSVPFWRTAEPGLSIDGVCTNSKCRSRGSRVLVNFGYTTLSLVEDVHLCRCPVCKSHVEPVTCGFNSCYWSLYGRKRNSPFEPPTTVKITGKYADNAWHSYDHKENGTARWLGLVITAKEEKQKVCWKCGFLIDRVSREVLPCGHSLHSDCTSGTGVHTCGRCQSTLTAFQRIRSAV